MNKNIVVIGASGDIGKEVVHQALEQGWCVIATVRNVAKRAILPHHPSLQVVFSDVARYECIQQDFQEIVHLASGQTLQAVVHCAAITHPSTVELLPLNSFEELLRVNTVGTLAALQAAMPYLRQSHGNFVLAGSLWGRISGPMVGAYAASKWALEALFDAARRETLESNCSLVMVNIGAVKSSMVDNHARIMECLVNTQNEPSLYSSVYKKHYQSTQKFNGLATTPIKVAKRLVEIAAAENPSPRYTIGKDAKALRLLNWVLPRTAIDRLLTA